MGLGKNNSTKRGKNRIGKKGRTWSFVFKAQVSYKFAIDNFLFFFAGVKLKT